jgi:hypothetical protein
MGAVPKPPANCNDASNRCILWREVRNMSFSMARLLMYNEQVPTRARDAIRAAYEGPPEHRSTRLESAARVLHQATGLTCSEVLELVGLPGGEGCA